MHLFLTTKIFYHWRDFVNFGVLFQFFKSKIFIDGWHHVHRNDNRNSVQANKSKAEIWRNFESIWEIEWVYVVGRHDINVLNVG